jgi:hypothetical protein
MQNSKERADEQLYTRKVIFTTGLKENGVLGRATSLKTNRIGFERIHDGNSS